MLNNNIDQSENIASNLLHARRGGFGFFLLLVVCVLLIVVTFFVGFPTDGITKTKVQKELDAISKQLAQTGEDEKFVQNYQAYIQKISEEKDKGAQYQLVFNLAQGFLAQYSEDHNPKLRILEEKFSNFAKDNFPDKYQANEFSVLCLDSECGKLEYTPEIIKIKKQVEAADLGLNKPSILNALENASFVTSDAEMSKSVEYSSLGAALMLLNLEEQSGKVAAKGISKELLAYTIRRFPGFANVFESSRGAVKK